MNLIFQGMLCTCIWARYGFQKCHGLGFATKWSPWVWLPTIASYGN